MNKKKVFYLSVITASLIVLLIWLFYKKSLYLKSDAAAKDLQKALLTYIEQEEVYPKTLEKIKFNNQGLSVKYEYLENGRGCRFLIEGKSFELWDEVR